MAEPDIDLMRANPPVTPYIHSVARFYISKSFGCLYVHPVYGIDVAAACKK